MAGHSATNTLNFKLFIIIIIVNRLFIVIVKFE